MYLFASILNEMFSSYVSLNSFTQLTVTGANTRVVYKWEPKSGNLNLGASAENSLTIGDYLSFFSSDRVTGSADKDIFQSARLLNPAKSAAVITGFGITITPGCRGAGR